VYYDLLAERDNRQATHAAIVRVEQLYPLPHRELTEVLTRYPQVQEVIWVQEEPRNMGAWGFVREHVSSLLPMGLSLRYVGRRVQASPAVGSQKIHQQEQAALIEQALAV
jgi:2-oxoglutarate dehydrogenase complex dehydrogenase (E1) component-like enzyme